MPDGTSRFSLKGKKIHHYMGCSTFSNYTVLPEIALAKIRPDAPFDKVCYIGCGVTTGIGAVINTAKVEPGANVVVFGLGGIGLNVVQGARMVGANMIVGVDLNPAREALGRKFGMTHFVNPEGARRQGSRGASRRADRRRRRLQLRMRRQHQADAPGAGMLPSRLGQVGDHRRRRRRPGDLHAARSSSSPAGTGWARPSAAPRGGATCRRSSTGTWTGKIDIDSLITHTMPVEKINDAFDLMHEGKSIRSVVTF